MSFALIISLSSIFEASNIRSSDVYLSIVSLAVIMVALIGQAHLFIDYLSSCGVWSYEAYPNL